MAYSILARLDDETFDVQRATPIEEMFGLASIEQLLERMSGF
jgi:hypothetical protein